jgi:hypothetical protein
MNILWVYVIAAALGIGRPLLIGHEPGHLMSGFAAASHLFVGGLIGAWIVSRRSQLMWIAGVLSAVEIGCFIAGRI